MMAAPSIGKFAPKKGMTARIIKEWNHDFTSIYIAISEVIK